MEYSLTEAVESLRKDLSQTYGLEIKVVTYDGTYRRNLCRVLGCDEQATFCASTLRHLSVDLCKKHAALSKLMNENVTLEAKNNGS